jgi:hypothetical protein
MPGLFGISTIKHHWSLMPVVGICGFACVLCGGYIGYMVATKPDISFKSGGWAKKAPYQDVSSQEIRKIYPHRRVVEVDPEIEKLKRELGSYKV